MRCLSKIRSRFGHDGRKTIVQFRPIILGIISTFWLLTYSWHVVIPSHYSPFANETIDCFAFIVLRSDICRNLTSLRDRWLRTCGGIVFARVFREPGRSLWNRKSVTGSLKMNANNLLKLTYGALMTSATLTLMPGSVVLYIPGKVFPSGVAVPEPTTSTL